MHLLDLIQEKRTKKKQSHSEKSSLDQWTACAKCQNFIDKQKLEDNVFVCPSCDHHIRISARQRIEMLVDSTTFQEKYADLVSLDPLNFCDTKPYKLRLEEMRYTTKLNDAVIVGVAQINGEKIALAVMDFQFIGGSLGSVVGEKITRLVEEATMDATPLLIVSQSGGARMQESIFSLMQMAKISQAIKRFQDSGLLYISLLCDPTMGGVSASFASQGDLIIAEPKAMIGFAGARVIEQTIKQKLPADAQTAEFQLKHGLIDAIVHRKKMKETIATIMKHFKGNYEKNLCTH
jgi:acetyl-CoA carboxylase carboxyl transferase subunit beta